MKKVMRAVMACAAMVLVAGCNISPKQIGLPELTFANVQPISINVAKIEVFDDYEAPMKEPNVEHLFKTPPDIATKSLIEKRLSADGVDNILRATIENASVVEQHSVEPEGVIGSILYQKEVRYNGKIVVRFELVNEQAPDIIIAQARVTATRIKNAKADITLADRDLLFVQMTEEMMKDVEEGLDTIVKSTFGKQEAPATTGSGAPAPATTEPGIKQDPATQQNAVNVPVKQAPVQAQPVDAVPTKP